MHKQALKPVVLPDLQVATTNFESHVDRFLLYAQVSKTTEKAYRMGLRRLFNYLKDNGITHPTTEDIYITLRGLNEHLRN